MGVRVRHWSEVIAEKVIQQKEEPFVIGSGITTSGPLHLGTICEFLYPSALLSYFKEKGYEARMIFIGDTMDAFDSIPAQLKAYEEDLKPHLGEPLAHVPDPYGCCPSYGEHFLNEVREAMEVFDVECEVYPAHELYSKGVYDEYARLFAKKAGEVRALLQEVSGRKLPDEWMDFVLPLCENCGKIATTRVVEIDENGVRYVCDKDVGYAKGCGHEGMTRFSEHKYKLMFRLDWPSRQDYFGVDVEGAGMDHHTKGGTWETAVAVHRRIFGKDPPVGFKFGFILFGGKKYSKSKGVGVSWREILELVPPEVLKYFLFKPNVDENKDFVPSPEKLIFLFEDYERARRLYREGAVTRSEQKKALAYRLSTKEDKWEYPFADLLLKYQVYKDWFLIEKEFGIREPYLEKYVETWVEKGMIPDRYKFEVRFSPVEKYFDAVRELALSLKDDMDSEEIQGKVFEVARARGIDPKDFFRTLYKAILGRESGPRMGRLIKAIGPTKVREGLLANLPKGRNSG